jgi:hypothetical protein
MICACLSLPRFACSLLGLPQESVPLGDGGGPPLEFSLTGAQIESKIWLSKKEFNGAGLSPVYIPVSALIT